MFDDDVKWWLWWSMTTGHDHQLPRISCFEHEHIPGQHGDNDIDVDDDDGDDDGYDDDNDNDDLGISLTSCLEQVSKVAA